jgi:hypothetical protein
MADIRYIDKDFVTFNFSVSGADPQRAILAFGDKVEILEEGTAGQPSRVRAWNCSMAAWRGLWRERRSEGARRAYSSFQ